ncbi:hypothetical protein DIPPA_19875 [Diplonema papillatum]|nr:hypothetical protein DIPPA_19875 [Diplonema papillatum]
MAAPAQSDHQPSETMLDTVRDVVGLESGHRTGRQRVEAGYQAGRQRLEATYQAGKDRLHQTVSAAGGGSGGATAAAHPFAAWITGAGACGCLYYCCQLFTGRKPRSNRYAAGARWLLEVYGKVAVGGAALLLGAEVWRAAPEARKVLPTWVAATLAPLPFVMHFAKYWGTLGSAENNREHGFGPLGGCLLLGYCSGPFADLAVRKHVLIPLVTCLFSTLAGHLLAVWSSPSATAALLHCAPASLSISVAALAASRQTFTRPHELLLQWQVLVSLALTAHTKWAVEIGDPKHFDTNTHALAILGCGSYALWAAVRLVFRLVSVPLGLFAEFEQKKRRLFTNVTAGGVLGVGYLYLLRVAHRLHWASVP